MKEKYQLIINSFDTKNRLSTTSNGASYYIDLNDILPKKYDKFKVKFYLISRLMPTNQSLKPTILSVSIGSNTLYDQSTSMTDNFSIITPLLTSDNSRNYVDQPPDESRSKVINYPQDTTLTISFSTYDGSVDNNATGQWNSNATWSECLTLYFEPL